LDGREITVQEDSITQPGQVKIIEDEGMPMLESQ